MSNNATWLGLIVDDYLVTDLLGAGGFGRVYKAAHVESGELAVLKVLDHSDPSAERTPTPYVDSAAQLNLPIRGAHPGNSPDSMSAACGNAEHPGSTHGGGHAEAIQLYSGGFGTVTPDPFGLITLEYERGLLASVPGFNCVKSVGKIGNSAYGFRQYFEGENLSQSVNAGSADPLLALNAVARAMMHLEQSPARYHGDLKPQNALVTSTGIELIDPGYYGSVNCREGLIGSCVITTPHYYPALRPDDLLAFGILAWELLLQNYPFSRSNSHRTDMGDSVLTMVRQQAILGRHAFKGLVSLALPCEQSNVLSPEMERLLLKLIKLRLERGKIELDEGFSNFEEISLSFERLIKAQD